MHMVSWALEEQAVKDAHEYWNANYQPKIISSPSQAFQRRKYKAASSVLSRWICHISYTPNSDAFSYDAISGRHGSPEDSKALRMEIPPLRFQSVLTDTIEKIILPSATNILA